MLKYLMVLMLVVFSACSKNEAEEGGMYGATWKISYFYDGVEKTADYAALYFMFNEDGTLMAHEGPRLTIGRWSESNSRFIILFDTNPLLLKIKGEWSIIEKTSSVIKLKDEVAAPNKELHLIRQ